MAEYVTEESKCRSIIIGSSTLEIPQHRPVAFGDN